MNGGIWGTAGRTVLAAVAVYMFGAYAPTPVRAADTGGGDCCSELEDRIAELEATTVRKGTKKVSLTVSGQLNKFLLFFDDGDEENVYVADSTYSSSRIRFVGSGKIDANWAAGYNLEFEIFPGASGNLNQNDDNGGPASTFGTLPRVRQNYLYLKDKRYGEVRMGFGSTPSDDLTRIDAAGYAFFSVGDWDASRGFFTRVKGAPGGNAGLTGATIGNLSGCFAETSTSAFDCPLTRRQTIQYVSPEVWGLTLQTAFGEDDLRDVALRYKKDFTNWKVVGGVGYAVYTDEREDMGAGGDLPRVETNALEAGLSVLHIPTGLFATASYNHSEIEDPDSPGFVSGVPDRPDGDSFYVEAGIKRKWWDYGPTGFFGTYARTDDQLGGIGCYSPTRPVCDGFTNAFNAFIPGNFVPGLEITGSELNRWGLGAVQSFDAASLDIFVLYEHTDFDVDLLGRVAGGGVARVDIPLEDFQSVILGARLIF